MIYVEYELYENLHQCVISSFEWMNLPGFLQVRDTPSAEIENNWCSIFQFRENQGKAVALSFRDFSPV